MHLKIYLSVYIYTYVYLYARGKFAMIWVQIVAHFGI